jgi:phosphoglycolate phosphatase-like HAD superfamily hydrolase
MVNKQYVSFVLFDMDNTLFDFVAAKLVACQEILSYIAREKESTAEDPSELFGYFLREIWFQYGNFLSVLSLNPHIILNNNYL